MWDPLLHPVRVILCPVWAREMVVPMQVYLPSPGFVLSAHERSRAPSLARSFHDPAPMGKGTETPLQRL